MSSEPPPPPPANPPPPPPPPPAPSAAGGGFDAAGQARVLFSQLDPTGFRPTAIVAGIILALFFGAQLVNAVIPQPGVGPGVPGPGGQGPSGPGPIPTTGVPTPGVPGPTNGPTGPTGPGPVTTPLPAGSTLEVGPLRIPLENGWVPQEVPDSNIIVRLTKGNAAIDLFSASIQGQADAATVYSFYLGQLQGDSAGFNASQPNLIQIGNGVAAARGTYTGVFGQSQIEGEVTTFVIGATGFIFDTWASAGTLRPVLAEADRMIDHLQVVQ